MAIHSHVTKPKNTNQKININSIKPSFDFFRKIKKIKILCVESFKKSKKIKNQKRFNMEGAPLPSKNKCAIEINMKLHYRLRKVCLCKL
jgi:hypothetical protein